MATVPDIAEAIRSGRIDGLTIFRTADGEWLVNTRKGNGWQTYRDNEMLTVAILKALTAPTLAERRASATKPEIDMDNLI